MFLRFDVFPVQTLVQFSAFYNFGFGTAAALVLVIFVAVILMIEGFLFRPEAISTLVHHLGRSPYHWTWPL